jgi:hypothetical protein
MTSVAETREHTLSPEQFLHHDTEMRAAKREKDDAGTALARVKKAAKNAAIDLKAYRFVEQLREMDDDEAAIIMRHMFQMMSWLEMPIGTKFSMIDAPKVPPVKAKAKQQHAVFLAGEAGLKAGREGESADANPHTEGSEEHVVWAKRQREGLEERVTRRACRPTTRTARRSPTTPRRQPGGVADGRARTGKSPWAMPAATSARRHFTDAPCRAPRKSSS